ncbi:hypothetical protein SUGI_0909890 [Cryptomeria japonica]|nr:hypothetical protein SUGI_0909890 [Cryptomeria japonica]
MHKQSEKAEQRKMKCVGRLRNELDIMGLAPFEETAIVDDLACRNLQRQAKLGQNNRAKHPRKVELISLTSLSMEGIYNPVHNFSDDLACRNLRRQIPRMEDILNLPVQDPPCAEFSAALLNWVKVEGGRQGGDDIALIPFSRVGDFVRGESTNADCPASFRIESRRKRAEGSLSRPRVDGYLEYTIYWCSYGPEDYRDSEPGSGDGSNNKPSSGKGSRPGRRHMMRGCLCHFTVKRLYTRPSIALMIYNQRNHVDRTGSPCHGSLDRDAIGTRAMYAPRISDELRQRIMSMLYIGISMDNIMQNHSEEVEKHGGPSNRDDLLTRNDVRNMERVIRQSTYELDSNDLLSIRTWVQRHQKYVFFYQDSSVSEPFILGIQTEWQLQQMIRFGHNSYIAADSTFGTNKLRCPLYTLLVFDVHQNALPVAWIISPSFASHSIHKWMGAFSDRARTKDPKWKPYAFMIDDAATDISVVRDVFQCRILLCLWRIRRAWLKNIIKRCSHIDVQREMFKRLGSILYTTRNGPTAMDAVEEFMQVFVDQNAFLEYFKIQWLPKIEIWVTAMRTLPLANQEMHGAIEAYHARLKPKLLNDLQSDACQRADWAIQIPDGDVLLDEDDLRYGKVVCQSDRTRAYIVWNPGSEFAFCDCNWSRLGNLCKHVIKVNIICRNHHLARPSLSLQTYRQIMLSLLQNPPDDPIVLDHAIVHATRMQHDLKGLTDLSNQGLLQPVLQVEAHCHGLQNPQPQAVPSVDRIAKRHKTSSPRTNVNNALIDLAGQNSVATNVHSMAGDECNRLTLCTLTQESGCSLISKCKSSAFGAAKQPADYEQPKCQIHCNLC